MVNARGADHIKAFIFDIGGVLVRSPLIGVNQFEKSVGLPHDYLNVAITSRGPAGAFQKLETGGITFQEFYDEFEREMNEIEANNAAYKRFCFKNHKTCPALPSITFKLDSKKLWHQMISQTSIFNQSMISLINQLKRSGKYKIAALTNNFQISKNLKDIDPFTYRILSDRTIKNLFMNYIDSSEVGLRKPDPKFFWYALDRLEVKPDEVVYLDDIGINLKAAQKLGINTIRVNLHHPELAIQELKDKFLPDDFKSQMLTGQIDQSKL